MKIELDDEKLKVAIKENYGGEIKSRSVSDILLYMILKELIAIKESMNRKTEDKK